MPAARSAWRSNRCWTWTRAGSTTWASTSMMSATRSKAACTAVDPRPDKRRVPMPNVTSMDGTTIAYSKTGNGPALIVVCGATQFRAFDPSLAVLADLLAPNYTVITYDRRGRGDSTDTQPYSTRREIEDIAALVDAAGGHASLLGYSSGSVLALEAAAAGLPIDKLVMYAPPFVLPGQPFPPPPADYVEALDKMTASGDRDAAPAYFMQSVGMPTEMVEGMKHAPMWPIMQSIGPTIAYDGRIMFEGYFFAG